MKTKIFTTIALVLSSSTWAQKVTTFTTTKTSSWVKAKTVLSAKAENKVVAEVNALSSGTKFVAFGTTFNELDWDAFNLLSRKEQDEVMFNIFDPQGDLKFTRKRPNSGSL